MRDPKIPYCEYVFEVIGTLCGSNALNVIGSKSYCDHHAKMISTKHDEICTCENVDDAHRGTWLVCGQCLKPRKTDT